MVYRGFLSVSGGLITVHRRFQEGLPRVVVARTASHDPCDC